MAKKLGVSIAGYVHSDLLAAKPAETNLSEWVEELLVLGMRAKRTETALENRNPLFRIWTSYLETFCILGQYFAFGGGRAQGFV